VKDSSNLLRSVPLAPLYEGRPPAVRCPSGSAHCRAQAAAERGYGGVTMEGIARESGVGKPTHLRWMAPPRLLFSGRFKHRRWSGIGAQSHPELLESDLRKLVRGSASSTHHSSWQGPRRHVCGGQLDTPTPTRFCDGLQSRARKGCRAWLKERHCTGRKQRSRSRFGQRHALWSHSLPPHDRGAVR